MVWRLPATESRGGLVSIQPHTVPRGAAWLLEGWHHIRVLDSRIAEENATLPYLEGEFSSPLPPHSPGWITWPCLATREAGKCNPLAPWLLAQPKSWSQEQLRKKERMANEHLAASPLDYHTCPTCFFLPSCFTDGHQNSAGVGTGQLFFHAILPALHESPVSGGEGSRGLLLGLGQHSGELRCGARAPGFESWFGGSRSLEGAATRMSRAKEWPSPLSGKVVLFARDPAASGGDAHGLVREDGDTHLTSQVS